MSIRIYCGFASKLTKSSSVNATRVHMYYTYIMTHKRNHLFYVGVTNDIKRRTFEHKRKARTDRNQTSKTILSRCSWGLPKATQRFWFNHTFDLASTHTEDNQQNESSTRVSGWPEVMHAFG